MKSLAKKIFQSKLLLSVIAILYGYFLWLMISQSFFSSLHIKAPVVLYEIPAKLQAQPQEDVDLHVSGRRFDLRQIAKQDVAININGKDFSNGNNVYTIAQEQIFLPDEIKLIDYNPAKLNILVY